MNGFEVPYPSSELAREVWNTFDSWLYDWKNFGGPQGRETYTGENMDGTDEESIKLLKLITLWIFM